MLHTSGSKKILLLEGKIRKDEYLDPTDRIWAWVGTEDLIHPSKK